MSEEKSINNNFADAGSTQNSEEPLLVGTNVTFKLDSSNNSASFDGESRNSPIAVGTNLTIELTDPDEQLLKQLGISKDGSNNYLGTNISADGDGSSWMERADNNPLAGGEIVADSDEEPLLVGTNITFKIISSDEQSPSNQDGAAVNKEQPSDSNSNAPIAVGTNLTLELTDSSGDLDDLIEQLGITENGSNDYLGNNISTSGDGNSWGNSTNADPLTGSGMTLVSGNAPQNDDLYQWDMSISAPDLTSDGNGDIDSSLDTLFEQSPWGTLKDVGITSFRQVFPNASGDLENNPFASGGDNPFAGDGAIS